MALPASKEPRSSWCLMVVRRVLRGLGSDQICERNAVSPRQHSASRSPTNVENGRTNFFTTPPSKTCGALPSGAMSENHPASRHFDYRTAKSHNLLRNKPLLLSDRLFYARPDEIFRAPTPTTHPQLLRVQPITADETQEALSKTSSSSAPGLSGINYKHLKWAFAARAAWFVSHFNGCLTFEFHPLRTAKVVPHPETA
jgi:hypothetical protein